MRYIKAGGVLAFSLLTVLATVVWFMNSVLKTPEPSGYVWSVYLQEKAYEEVIRYVQDYGTEIRSLGREYTRCYVDLLYRKDDPFIKKARIFIHYYNKGDMVTAYDGFMEDRVELILPITTQTQPVYLYRVYAVVDEDRRNMSWLSKDRNTAVACDGRIYRIHLLASSDAQNGNTLLTTHDKENPE